MNTNHKHSLLLAAAALSFSGCILDMGKSDVQVKNVVEKEGEKDFVPTDDPIKIEEPAPSRCDLGTSYEGFGGQRLEVGRDDEDQGFDRDRVKPYSALSGEYFRVLGKTPALLATMGSTFGATPPRWYIEPESNAISLYSSVRVAFVGCLDLTAGPAEFATAPSLTTAKEQCQKFAKRFWSRSASAEEEAACVTVATTGTSAEPDARRKWAYTCASVLSSAPFLTY